MAAPASPTILCGAPLTSGGGSCKRKGRPCGIKSHHLYWSKKIASGVDEDSDSENGDASDEDSVVSTEFPYHSPGKPHLHSDDDDSDTDLHASVGVDDCDDINFKAPSWYLHTKEARNTAQRLHKEHFSQPYNASLKKFCDEDWSLDIPGSKRIERPNHGLAHSMRSAYAVPVTVRLLLRQLQAKQQQSPKKASSQQQAAIMSVTSRDVRCAQYMMLFAVVGRENEIGWFEASQLQERQIQQGNPHAPHLYDQFKENARRILREHFQHDPPSSLQLSKAEKEGWVKALDIGVPNLASLIGLAMRLAHDADLMRCYTPEQFQAKVEDEFVELLGESGAKTLCDYMFQLIQATGDRCAGLGKDSAHYRPYNKQLFARSSTDVDALLAALASVPQPLQSMPLPADPVDGGDDGNDDDDGASHASHKSNSSMDSLISAFKSKMKLSSDSDVSMYEQLRFTHSRAATAFRSGCACPRCFLVKNGLNNDFVMEIYTSPKVFKQLNLALCQGANDFFAKMYTLALCKAITDSKHDAATIPPVVWRGVSYSDELLQIYQANVGRTIYLYNFTSTSRSKTQALAFASQGKHPTLIEIRVPEAARVAMADLASPERSQFIHEQENLIACNAGYRIDAVDLVQRTLTLTVVDVSKCLLGEPPYRYCAPCLKVVQADKWEAGAAAKLKQKQ